MREINFSTSPTKSMTNDKPTTYNHCTVLSVDILKCRLITEYRVIFVVQNLLLDTPLLNGIFKISTLNAVQWLYVVGLSLVILLVGEVEKLISRMRS